jgi:hypothetical protein
LVEVSMSQNLAPEDITRGALRVLYVAALTTRNWTLSDEISRKQLNDLWESLHEVPNLLMRWDGTPEMEKELESYFAEYTKKWKTPDFVSMYKQYKKKQNEL